MRKLLIRVFILIFAGASPVLLGGCSSSTTQNANTSVMDMAWLPDESGLVAYIENTLVSAVDNSQALTGNIYHVSSGGGIGNAINGSDQGINYPGDFAPIVFITPDGKTAVTAFETNTFQINLSSGNATIIVQNAYMYGASPDLHYLIDDIYQPVNSSKNLEFFDLTKSPIRLAGTQQTQVGVTGNRALWIDS